MLPLCSCIYPGLCSSRLHHRNRHQFSLHSTLRSSWKPIRYFLLFSFKSLASFDKHMRKSYCRCCWQGENSTHFPGNKFFSVQWAVFTIELSKNATKYRECISSFTFGSCATVPMISTKLFISSLQLQPFFWCKIFKAGFRCLFSKRESLDESACCDWLDSLTFAEIGCVWVVEDGVVGLGLQ